MDCGMAKYSADLNYPDKTWIFKHVVLKLGQD